MRPPSRQNYFSNRFQPFYGGQRQEAGDRLPAAANVVGLMSYKRTREYITGYLPIAGYSYSLQFDAHRPYTGIGALPRPKWAVWFVAAK